MHISSPPCVLHVPFLSFFFIGSPEKYLVGGTIHEASHYAGGPGQLSRYIDLLRAGRSGDRIPVGGEIFRTRPDRPWGLLSHCTMHTGSFPGVKRPGRGVDHPCPSSAEVKERVELYLCSPSTLSWQVME